MYKRIKKATCKCNEWPIGRIVLADPGRDGLVSRVSVEVPNKGNQLKRLVRSVRDIGSTTVCGRGPVRSVM